MIKGEHKFDPNYINLLHVEDQSVFADIDDGGQYRGSLKNPVENVLKAVHNLPSSRICWKVADKAEDAFDYLEEVHSNDNFLDAVFCDLRLEESHEEGGGAKYTKGEARRGLRVAERVSQFGWPCAIIGLTGYMKHHDVQELKTAVEAPHMEKMRLIFDEFLAKAPLERANQEDIENIETKLRRILIPTRRYAEGKALYFSPPFVCTSQLMMCLLRKLVSVALSQNTAWPPMIALLSGVPGSGREAVARTYDQLCSDFGDDNNERKRAPSFFVDCNIVAGLPDGGRALLFGDNARRDATGILQQSTFYEGERIDFPHSGLVYFHEYDRLEISIQRALKAVLRSGVLLQSNAALIHIGCQVFLSTNDTGASLGQYSGEKRIVEAEKIEEIGDDADAESPNGEDRELDLGELATARINVPSLWERNDNEIFGILRSLTAYKIRQKGADDVWPQDVEITPSATSLIRRALTDGRLKSCYDLNLISHLANEERFISDGNVHFLFTGRKLASGVISAKDRLAPLPAAEVDLTHKVDFLHQNCTIDSVDGRLKEVKDETVMRVIDYYYQVATQECGNQEYKNRFPPKSAEREIYYLITDLFIDREKITTICGFTPQRASGYAGKTAEILRNGKVNLNRSQTPLRKRMDVANVLVEWNPTYTQIFR